MVQPPQVQRIGRYEVVRKIATGGMAELFLARYTGPGGFEKRCALKRILPQFASDQAFTRMFLTEAKITAQLDHPNIVQIFELGQDDNGQYFIAMEMVNGVNLRQLLTMATDRLITIPPALAAFIATQALEGLAYAHELKNPDTGAPLNLVHRDVSPHNILVSYEGTVKLVDFGIVKGTTTSHDTHSGLLKGKVAYMSPEQATGEPLDGRSDLFSLAVVLFELIAGRRPFTGINELMTLKAILERPPKPLTELAPDCPEGIERAIYRGLAKYPQERFADARAFHLELDHVLRACPIPLGRHVIAEFIRSLTEGSTVPFDASRLTIPRGTQAGFASQLLSTPDPHRPWAPAEALAADASGPASVAADLGARDPGSVPGSFSSASGVLLEATPTSGDSAARPRADLVGDLVTGELQAAGVRPRSATPAVIATLAIAALVAGWLWQRSTVDAVIVSPMAPLSSVEVIDAGANPEPTALPLPHSSPDTADGGPGLSAPSKAPAKARSAATPRKASANGRRAVRRRPRGRLVLRSDPEGLVVRRKGRRLGRTPLDVELTEGPHTLLLRSKSRGISRRIEVRIAAGQQTEERVVIGKGALQIISRPWAQVFVNGKHRGQTPAKIELYVGRHQVKLISADGDERIQLVEVVEGPEPQLMRVIF